MGLKRFNLKIGLLIAVYNEEKTISRLIEGLLYPRKVVNTSRDIIIVDDGSTDNTYEVVKNMGVTVFKHTKNLGKGQALQTGFKYAIEHNYDYVITLDGDGQHDPQELPEFIKRIEQMGEDIIIGTRHRSLINMPFVRYWANLISSFIVSFLSHKTINDVQSGYRAISAKVMNGVHLTTSHFDTESEIIIRAARLGYRIGKVPISTIYRGEKSKMRPIVDTMRFIMLVFKSIWR